MRIVFIGMGGIGTQLLPPVCRHLGSANPGSEVVIFDGDAFESKNANRQEFSQVGRNKAEERAEGLRARFPSLTIEAKPVYVTDDNIFLHVKDGDVVLSCVDNYPSRKTISMHVQTLENVVLISGGNDLTDGNAQIHVRKAGVDMTPPITKYHPEIENTQGKNPADMSCEELAQAGVTQIIFANFMAAAIMLSAFWHFVVEQKVGYAEAYFDLNTGAVRSVTRS